MHQLLNSIFQYLIIDYVVMENNKIIVPFSVPDITDLEINEVIDTLKSGWITTGHKTKLLENRLSKYCNTKKQFA